jgi:transposase
MKGGRKHLAHKAEDAVDMETGAIVAVTRHGADEGDTLTIQETVSEGRRAHHIHRGGSDNAQLRR